MTNVYFTTNIQNAILIIAAELQRMNDLKEKELQLKYEKYDGE